MALSDIYTMQEPQSSTSTTPQPPSEKTLHHEGHSTVDYTPSE